MKTFRASKANRGGRLYEAIFTTTAFQVHKKYLSFLNFNQVFYDDILLTPQAFSNIHSSVNKNNSNPIQSLGSKLLLIYMRNPRPPNALMSRASLPYKSGFWPARHGSALRAQGQRRPVSSAVNPTNCSQQSRAHRVV